MEQKVALSHQRAHDAPCRLCSEPAPPQVGGGVCGWIKTVGGLRRTRWGVDRTGLAGYLVATAYNLVRMAHLPPAPEAEPVPSG